MAISPRFPSSQQIEMFPGGNLVVQNIQIEDIADNGGRISWSRPQVNGSGGITAFTITSFHAELLNEAGTEVLERVPALPQESQEMNSATFLNYPSNANHPDYDPSKPPENKVRIVSYTNKGQAHSAIIIEDIVMKDEPGGFLQWLIRLPGRILRALRLRK